MTKRKKIECCESCGDPVETSRDYDLCDECARRKLAPDDYEPPERELPEEEP